MQNCNFNIRPNVSYTDECDRFRCVKYSFGHQYCHTCFVKFVKLQPLLVKASLRKWKGVIVSETGTSDNISSMYSIDDNENKKGNIDIIERENDIEDIKENKIPLLLSLKELESDVECIIIGLIYKEMKLRPTVLDEYLQDIDAKTDENQITNFCSSTDKLYIEDTSSRICLSSPDNILDSSKYVSGTVIAVKGVQTDSGIFIVNDYCLPEIPILKVPCNLSDNNSSELLPIYIGFVSGLNIGDPRTDPLPLQLLRDFITGQFIKAESMDINKDIASRIVRLIIAGNTMSFLDTAKEMQTNTGSKLIVDKDSLNYQICEVDTYLAQLASVINVDIMSGPQDPVPISMPQPQMHPSLFPNSKDYDTFRPTTNPYSFSINNVRIIGVSGHSIDDVMAYSSYKEPIDALKYCVESRSLAPTAPDTLPCYPLFDDDVLSLDYPDDQFPHLVFAGNQSKFQSFRFSNGPLCITIPKFSEIATLVLVDINSLKTKTINFG
ncbi:DNA polymerase epsilon subunit B family protein [Cryptosporidium serpentis]